MSKMNRKINPMEIIHAHNKTNQKNIYILLQTQKINIVK